MRGLGHLVSNGFGDSCSGVRSAQAKENAGWVGTLHSTVVFKFEDYVFYYFSATEPGSYDDKDKRKIRRKEKPQNVSIFTNILLYIDHLWAMLSKSVCSVLKKSLLLVCLKNTNKNHKLIVKNYYKAAE